MNNTYTQVNIAQLEELIKAMGTAQTSCNAALDAFVNVMDTLLGSGQIAGKALIGFNKNIGVIKKLQSEFTDYCLEATKNLNNIITEEKQIESNYENLYNDLLAVNPEDYVG